MMLRDCGAWLVGYLWSAQVAVVRCEGEARCGIIVGVIGEGE